MVNSPIKSMTGFGRIQRQTELGQILVEVRTVNNRFQDLTLALPHELAAFETPLRALFKQEIPRGKIDCRIRFTPSDNYQPRVAVNVALVRQYLDQFAALREAGVAGEPTLDILAALPGVLTTAPPAMDEATVWPQLESVVREAVEALNGERAREGAALARQLRGLGRRIEQLRAQIEAHKDLVLERFRERLVQRLAQLQAGAGIPADPGRLEMEVALYADRCDLSEELVRLKTHLERLEAILNEPTDEPVGKSLEFLTQEIAREINTICSKSRETAITSLGLEMKNLAESIREQIQNIQ